MPPLILVVDDEPVLLEGLALFLREEGYRVRTAGDGSEALRQQQADPADAILSDVMMPVLDGYELVERLRAAGDRTPVVLMSAGGMPCSRWDHVWVMAKPFDLDTVLGAIAAATGRP